MPEYLAPGVFVEETSFRAKTIEGVSTSTTGFIGPTRFGPIAGEPELLTSFTDFERIYGGLDPLEFNGKICPNYLAHAVRVFFNEGGKRLYVSRVYTGSDGRSRATNESSSPADDLLIARFPGKAGDIRITFLPKLSDNILVKNPTRILRIKEYDTVMVAGLASPGTNDLFDVVRDGDDLVLKAADGSLRRQDELNPDDEKVYLMTTNVTIERPIIRRRRPNERYEIPEVLEGFGFHPSHSNSLCATFSDNPPSRRLALTVPFAINKADSLNTGIEIAIALLGEDVIDALVNEENPPENRQRVYQLRNGSDGSVPSASSYEGDSMAATKSGLATFEDLEDISIVAAPGYSYTYRENDEQLRVASIQGHLINHCHKMRYRIGILDSVKSHVLSEVREYRGKVDSTHAAMYYPWVTIMDPTTEDELSLPPSGFVAGIYARNDVERGVHKSPANEVVRSAIGFEILLNKGQQEALNPEGINCLRFFEGRGFRVWGARTISSDPEWKYLNVRRYFAYLERSIEKGTQWAVFENNGHVLWANVRTTIEDFLFNEWKENRLLGTKPDQAYFVRCDRSTMSQNDLDNGRLICLVGVAPLKPAEFVIFRIGQWTADRRS